ncbi:MAG: cbb3-type cytochrome c oxidase subunit I [Cyanobacteria bacterium]|nr:cbb3-type cytochrome c oxidase subunit I [Cyanobacteriota bacterium]
MINSKFLSSDEGSSAKFFMFSAIVWLVLGMAAGLLAALEFSFPDLTKGIPQLSFTHLRPAHVNTIAFGWLSMANIGSALYIIPALCKTKLYSEKLANFVCYVWNFVIGGGAIALMNGFTEGREYAEYTWPFDILVLVGLFLLSYNLFRTVLNRQVKKLYVSVWYIMGAFFWMPFVYLVGNRTFVAMDGLNDGILNWFYGHNILGMWFTVLGVGIAYYMVPKMSGKPIWSHSLSMIGFWTIAFFYAPTGTHHLLQSPVPEWLKALAVIFSAALVIPVITVLTNFYMSMKGSWWMLTTNMPLRFVMTGAFWYFITCIQGPFQATRGINWYIHFTQWVVAHAHAALLGTFTFFVIGSLYYGIQRLTGKKIYSVRLVKWHYWLLTIGFLLFFLSLTVGGLQQSVGWALGYPVAQWSLILPPMWLVRSIGGVMMFASSCLFAYNIFRSMNSPSISSEDELNMAVPTEN